MRGFRFEGVEGGGGGHCGAGLHGFEKSEERGGECIKSELLCFAAV